MFHGGNGKLGIRIRGVMIKTVCLSGAFRSSKDNKNMFKIAFQPMFDHSNVNLRKNEGFLTYIPCIPIPEYGQSNAPTLKFVMYKICHVSAASETTCA